MFYPDVLVNNVGYWNTRQLTADGLERTFALNHLAQVTGRYFANSKPKRSSKPSYDQAAVARFWQVSAELVA